MRRWLMKINYWMEEMCAWGELMSLAVLFFFPLIMFAKVLQPLSPLFTAVFIIGFTVRAVQFGKLTATFSLGGILIYIAAWPITSHFGTWVGLVSTTIGALLWIWSVFRTFENWRPLNPCTI